MNPNRVPSRPNQGPDLCEGGEHAQVRFEAGHLGEADFLQRFLHAFASEFAVEDGGFDQAGDGAGRGLADGDGFEDLSSIEHVAHAAEELDRVDLHAVIMQESLDDHGQRARAQDQQGNEHDAELPEETGFGLDGRSQRCGGGEKRRNRHGGGYRRNSRGT